MSSRATYFCLLPRHQARLTTRTKIGEICMHTCASRSFPHSGWDWWVFSTATSTAEKKEKRFTEHFPHRWASHAKTSSNSSLADSHYEYLISKSAEIFLSPLSPFWHAMLAADAFVLDGLSNFWLRKTRSRSFRLSCRAGEFKEKIFGIQ